MSGPNRVALALVRLACRLLPVRLRSWGSAMVHEVATIPHPVAALRFALGCLGFALHEAIASHIRTCIGARATQGKNMDRLIRPDRMIVCCGVAATLLGLAYLSVAGAPVRYVAMHGGSLAMGLLAIGIVSQAARLVRIPLGAVSIAMGLLLVLTALFGASAEGAARWVVLGGVSVQPSLVVLPVLAIGFARSRDAASMAAILLAAVALALQPDRAMAGALAAGMAVLMMLEPRRNVAISLVAALSGFVVTLLRPDTLPATPLVDGVLQSAFDVHPVAGLAVWIGTALLLLPPMLGLIRDSANRAGWAVFGALWLGVVVAAVLGNYPTPLVGYGGSAIVGYMLCRLGVIAQRNTVGQRVGDQGLAGDPQSDLMPRISALGG